MPHPGTDSLHDETRTQPSGPHAARSPRSGPQRREDRRRRGRAWALLTLSVAMLITGVTLPQGLLLAAGLVTAGMATYLLVPPHGPDRPGLFSPTSARHDSDHTR
ncbi:DUF3040 domain-containing protein [Streptomyces sp. NPDC002285]